MSLLDILRNIFQSKNPKDDMSNFNDIPSEGDEIKESENSDSTDDSGSDFDSGDSGSDD